MINPDDLATAEELQALLVRLGFDTATISTGGHISRRIEGAKRFACVEHRLGVLIYVLRDNTLLLHYWWPDRDGWQWEMDGELRGPCSEQELIDAVKATGAKAFPL